MKRALPEEEGSHDIDAKRPHVNSSNDEDELESFDSTTARRRKQPHIDPTYGQRTALPCLDDLEREGVRLDADDEAALAYLREVRQEAKSVPNLLIAPSINGHRNGLHNGAADGEVAAGGSAQNGHPEAASDPARPLGFYSDGAYTAHALNGESAHFHLQVDNEKSPTEAQDAYYAALVRRFVTLQAAFARLRKDPSRRPTQDRTATILAKSRKRSIWRGKLLKVQPTPTTLAQLPYESVIYGLDVLGDLILREGNIKAAAHGPNLGAWGWGLLVSCRALGEMGSEDVGVLRDLGKKAIWRLRRSMVANEAEDPWSAEEEDEVVDEEVAVDAAKKRLLDSVNGHVEDSTEGRVQHEVVARDLGTGEPKDGPSADLNMMATLDMIVSLIGEVYGQKDLLDQRVLWDEL